MHPAAQLLSAACLAMALPAAAHAQAVQRCVGADGRAVYTDRRCDDIGAVDRLPPPGTAEGAHVFRGMCPRVLSQLVGEVGAAIRAGDANRLAGIYDWSGVSGKAASRVLDRLEAMVGRPLVDIAPVYPGYATDAAPPAPAPTQAAAPAPNRASEPPADRTAWMSSWPGMQPPEPTVDTSTLPAPPPLPPAPVRTHPVALRVEQTLSGSATPVRTVFGLRRTYGCFWITL